MKPFPYATTLRAGLVVTLLLIGGGHAVAASPDQPTSALTAEEAIACIRTATAAQAGFVKEIEGDDEGGKRICEVKMVDQTGKHRKLHVDVQTNAVIKAK